jgi:hypothetical protein
VHLRKYRNELSGTEKKLAHFCTPDDALVVRNMLGFYIQSLSQFVKPPSDNLLRYLNMFHLAPSPSSLELLLLRAFYGTSPFSLKFILNMFRQLQQSKRNSFKGIWFKIVIRVGLVSLSQIL